MILIEEVDSRIGYTVELLPSDRVLQASQIIYIIDVAGMIDGNEIFFG